MCTLLAFLRTWYPIFFFIFSVGGHGRKKASFGTQHGTTHHTHIKQIEKKRTIFYFLFLNTLALARDLHV